MEIHKVSEVGMYGEEVKPKFYKLLDDAKQAFDNLMEKLQKEYQVIKGEEDVVYGKKPVEIINGSSNIFPSDVLREGVN
ncbi:hypothetical protein [Bacillus pseudomycoides]|uniref:hypothetical protein n=1 Tax=Bacillus pseudomycoides TaxID=64104 RepID=UPI001FB2604A|nr:hypothetical protein [Bacillus pseudomycoides]